MSIQFTIALKDDSYITQTEDQKTHLHICYDSLRLLKPFSEGKREN
jgi:hypothetical protein